MSYYIIVLANIVLFILSQVSSWIMQSVFVSLLNNKLSCIIIFILLKINLYN